MGGFVGGWMDGWMKGRTDKWMNGWILNVYWETVVFFQSVNVF